jgi:hypothetical protein
MQILLQDVIDYLPLVRGPSPTEEGLFLKLLNELMPFLMPFVQALGGALVVGWGCVLAAYGEAKDYITKAEFIPSVMILASSTAMMFASGKSEKGTVVFKFGEHEARWKGALALSVLLSGALLLALIEWKKT